MFTWHQNRLYLGNTTSTYHKTHSDTVLKTVFNDDLTQCNQNNSLKTLFLIFDVDKLRQLTFQIRLRFMIK